MEPSGKTGPAVFEELVKTLLERDELRRAAEACQNAYVLEFGELVSEIYRRRTACMRKEKMIEYCRRQEEYGRAVQYYDMLDYAEQGLSSRDRELAEITEEIREAAAFPVLSASEEQEIQSIYRELVLMIHPDLHRDEGDPSWKIELWSRISGAYNRSDLSRLKQLKKEAEDRAPAKDAPGREANRLSQIANPEGELEQLKREIEEIVTSEPYVYKLILDDRKFCREKKTDMQRDIDGYNERERELDAQLRRFSVENIIS